MFSDLENMKEFTNEWNDNSSSVDAKLALREEKRKKQETLGCFGCYCRFTAYWLWRTRLCAIRHEAF